MKTSIQPATLRFLSNLKINNTREWFAENKEQFNLAKENFQDFVQSLILKVSEFDKTLEGVEPQKCIFRIYRDVRFSHDKTPYKTNFAATLKGRGNGLAGYYLQLEPGATFIAGGLYGPKPEALKAIRQEISYNGEAFSKILNDKNFKRELKFEGGKLQRVPQGFDKEDPMAEFIKHKDFTVFHAFSDEAVLNERFMLDCSKVCKLMVPLNEFLNVPVLEVN